MKLQFEIKEKVSYQDVTKQKTGLTSTENFLVQAISVSSKIMVGTFVSFKVYCVSCSIFNKQRV
jgi:hypothetical protein